MPWNWQQPDWPNFVWDKDNLAAAEQQFLIGGGVRLERSSIWEGKSTIN
jgi:Domain of unknown function (DUF4172)